MRILLLGAVLSAPAATAIIRSPDEVAVTTEATPTLTRESSAARMAWFDTSLQNLDAAAKSWVGFSKLWPKDFRKTDLVTDIHRYALPDDVRATMLQVRGDA